MISVARWVDIVLLSLVGAGMVFIASPALNRFAELLGTSYSQSNPIALWLLLVFTTLSFGYFGAKSRIVHWPHFIPRLLVRFPPTVLAGIIGIAFYSGLVALFPASTANPTRVSGLDYFFAFLCVALGVGGRWIHEFGSKNLALSQNASSLADSNDGQVEFSEVPLRRPGGDWIGTSAISRRIAAGLLGGELRTVAIVGPYGAGKSSVVEMMRHYLEHTEELSNSYTWVTNDNHPRPVVCNIGAWGLTREGVAERILREILRSASDHVDVLALNTIPRDYAETIAGVGGAWMRPLSVLSSIRRSPLELLQEIDLRLQAQDTRLIVVIEDAERGHDENLVRVELGALLDLLRQLKNVRFILAITDEFQHLDVLKRLFHSVEYVPSPSIEQLVSKLHDVREQVETEFVAGILRSPYSKEARDGRFGVKPSAQELVLAEMSGKSYYGPIQHLASLFRTPRALNLAIRQYLSVWKNLKGEVDPDELLTVIGIQHSCPSAFSFIGKNLEALRGLPYLSKQKDRDSRRMELDSRLAEAIADSNELLPAIRFLTEFLFPGAFAGSETSKADGPQRINSSSPNDYWNRIVLGETPLGIEIRDQDVMNAIRTWQRSEEQYAFRNLTLADAMIDIKGFSDLVEFFGRILSPSEVRILAGQLFRRIVERGIRPFANESGRGDYPGHIQLWRLSLDRRWDGHKTWLSEVIREVIGHDLRLALDIYYFWRVQERGPGGGRVREPKIRAALNEAFLATFGGHPEKLGSALDPSYPYSLYHFVVRFSEPDEGGEGFEASEWEWIAPILLEAADASPESVVPAIANLLTNELRDIEHQVTFEFESDRGKAIFGERYLELMRLLATEREFPMLDAGANARTRFVQGRAQDMLEADTVARDPSSDELK